MLKLLVLVQVDHYLAADVLSILLGKKTGSDLWLAKTLLLTIKTGAL